MFTRHARPISIIAALMLGMPAASRAASAGGGPDVCQDQLTRSWAQCFGGCHQRYPLSANMDGKQVADSFNCEQACGVAQRVGLTNAQAVYQAQQQNRCGQFCGRQNAADPCPMGGPYATCYRNCMSGPMPGGAKAGDSKPSPTATHPPRRPVRQTSGGSRAIKQRPAPTKGSGKRVHKRHSAVPASHAQ